MAKHNDLGHKGEEFAVKYLKEKGYYIRETNWRDGKLELDIIAEIDNRLIIAEVKTRYSDYISQPTDAITNTKIRNIVKATDHYIKMNNIDKEVRFDIISLVKQQNSFKIEHIEDAFIAPVN